MNRTVLVTGASRGIGRAIASAFAAEGDRLIITCSRSEQELLNFKKELEETFHTEVLASVGDISSFEYVEQLFEQITERFGGVDVLINNAGISYIGLLTDMSIDDWNRIVSTNLTSVFSTSRLAIPHMVHEKAIAISVSTNNQAVTSLYGNMAILLRKKILQKRQGYAASACERKRSSRDVPRYRFGYASSRN